MTKNKPKISVIMPVYNTENFLDESIQSILNQSFSDFEFIVINDASTDNSDGVIKKYLKDTRIVYIKNKVNRGIPYNRNLGLKLSRADIIANMDSDDISDCCRFAKQYNYLMNHKDIALVGSFIKVIDENSNVIGKMIKPIGPEKIKKVCFFYSPHAQPAIMFRKDIINKIGNYREEYPFCQDIDLYFRVIFSGYKTNNIPEYLLKYRKHSNSTDKYSKQKGILSFQLKKEMIKKFNLKLDFKDYVSMYIHYILDRSLAIEQKSKIESFVKKYFVNQ